jgi:putative aldouronate transport system substrate-binding protein
MEVSMKRIMMGMLIILISSGFVFARGQSGGSSSAAGQAAEITVEVFNRGTDGGRTDPTNNNWTKWIQEKILKEENIKVTFVSIPRTEEIPALTNLMAAGTPPDICLTYTESFAAQYRDLGGLYDMAPRAEALLPDLKKFLGPDQALPGRDLMYRYMINGKVFYIPARRANVAHRGTFIRKDWLDKLGLPLPKTTQEFYEALKAFKEKDPGGIGSARVIPITSNKGTWFQFGNLAETFVDPNISDRDRWVYTVVDRTYLYPGYKEGVRFLNKMYNEGLIDPDFPLQSADDPVWDLIKSGRVGAYSHNWDQVYRDSPGMLRDLQKNVPGAEMVPIDPFTNSRGVTYKSSHDAVGVLYFIPASSKNPEAAMRYLNWLARDENRIFLQIGPEGILHDMVNGVPRIKAATGLWIQNSPQNIDYTLMINGLDLGDPDKSAQALAFSYTVDPQLIVDAYAMSMANAKPLPVVPDVALTAAGPYVQTLQDKGDVLMAESITCPAAQFDRVWDAGIADWLASGAQAILNERIAKYAAPK